MRIVIGNFQLQKADRPEDDKYVYVRMIANRLDIDKENQQILPQAFSKATIENFLKNGIIDWHHQSVLGKTSEERAKAILGEPYDFKWEDGLPVVYARLTKGHPIVRDSILPHLDAEQRVFSASVGGSIKKIKKFFDKAINTAKEEILAIDWNHLAIAATPYVISAGSAVSMVKAQNDLCVEFSDVSAFESEIDIITKEGELRKALQMGAGTDVSSLAGADALRMQSLEGDRQYNRLRDDVMFAIMDGTITPSRDSVMMFLKAKGVPERESRDFLSQFLKSIRNAIQTI